MSKRLDRAIAAAASLTGNRFSLLVASSLVATAAIVASALAGTNDSGGALAALLSRSPASQAPAATVPAGGSGFSAAGSSGRSTPTPSGPAPSSPPLVSTPELSTPAPSSKTASAPSKPATPTETAAEAGRIKHVFVISLASFGYEAAFGAASQMPYLSTTLRPQGELLSGYELLGSAALPNQIAAISGQPPNAKTRENCAVFSDFPAGAALDSKGVVGGDGCLYPVEALTLADQLTAGRFKWRGYMEGMVDEAGKPDSCVHPESDGSDQPVLGGYATRNNPFVYFHSLLDLGDCALNDQPLTQLSADLGKVESTPNYALISPNLCNAGVPGQCAPGAPEGAASADAFLAQWVPAILASPAYEKDGLLIVTFGEVNPPDPAAAPAAPVANPQVGALLLSRFVAPGSTDSKPYDPYSLLASIEDLFGFERLALAARAKTSSFAPALLGETETSGD